MTVLRTAVAALAIFVLASCSTLQSTGRITAQADTEGDASRQAIKTFKDQARDYDRAKGQQVELPWIAGRPQPLAREVSLPAALRANVNTTMLFESGAADLGTIADRIQLATGIPTQVAPDALLPREYFLPRLGSEQLQVAAAAMVATTSDTLVPALVPVPSVDRDAGPTLPVGIARTKMEPLPGGKVPLASVLDSVALRLGVYWRYDDKVGAIRFYRVETRTFYVKALSLAADTSLELGLTGTGNTQSSNAQFASQNRSKYSTSQGKPTDAVLVKVSQYLTRAGVVKAAEGAANSIVVTDTKDALDAVGQFLESENRILSRRVRIVFEEVTVQLDTVGQSAVDWNLIFNSAGRANSAASDSPASLFDSTKAAGSAGVTVGSGPFAGSKLLLSALSEVGTVVRHTSIPILTSNLRSYTFATRETVPYIKDLQQTPSYSNNSAPTVTVTQDEKTVGTFLTVVPNAQDDGRVQLTVSYDDTRLIGALQKQEFGSPDNPSYVQQAKVGGQGVIQQVEVKPGQAVVIGGYEQAAGDSTRRRLDERAPILLGGSDAAEEKKLVTVIAITAIPEEGY